MEISELLESNLSFADGTDKELLKELAEKGQEPVAAIVSCSDSRVPVEVIFNQTRPGTFFVIRVAGNIVSDASVKGSIEYAVNHLKVPYVIVLGHTDCGAVKSYLASARGGEVGKLLRSLKLRNRDLTKAVIENVDVQVARVLEMDSVKEARRKRSITVYGMLYDLRSGRVKCLSKNGEAYKTGDP